MRSVQLYRQLAMGPCTAHYQERLRQVCSQNLPAAEC